MIRLRHLAPAGAPIRAGDLFRWAIRGAGGGDSATALAQLLSARFGVQHCFATLTGRAGLTMLLRALRTIDARPARTEVVVPAYTCFSVAASIIKAGLTPRLVDVSPATLDYDERALANTDLSRALAVIATNLYGLPSNMPALAARCAGEGIFLVDDAAQAMGARVNGRWSGTWGDAGLFSFDKGKNVAAIDGGVIVTNRPDVAEAMSRELAAAAAPSLAQSAVHVGKALAYAALLRPALYGVPANIPQLGLGQTPFDTAFPLARADRALLPLAVTMMSRLDSFTDARIRNAEAIVSGLQPQSGLTAVTATAGARSVFLRLPLLCRDEGSRRNLIAELTRAGIGASASYPRALPDVPEVTSRGGAAATYPGARDVASRLITLPTHPFVGAHDIRRVLAIVNARAAAAAPRPSPNEAFSTSRP